MELIINISVGISLLLFGFSAGVLHERVKWNDLIRAGLLPKPKVDS